MHSDEIRQVRGARLDVGIVEGLVAVGKSRCQSVRGRACPIAMPQFGADVTDFPLTVTFFLLRPAYNLLRFYGGLART